MAAPTDVRVEAQSITSAILRWTYPGTAVIDVYRSTDGAAYTRITDNITNVAAGTVTYTDTTLSTGTKYWYKLSDDVGSTFSSVVTVWSHGCLTNSGGLETFILPRSSDEAVPSDTFNDLASRIESALGERVLNPEQCIACPDDGAVVIDCSEGCRDWVVIADQNINSVSIQWCEGGEGNIEFLLPPSVTREICGFPAGFGFSGDECSKAPLVSGPFGMSMNVGWGGASGAKADPSGTRSSRNVSSGVGRGGGGGAACTCVPTANGALTIKSCTPNNSLSCSSTKSLTLKVCGGRGPYTWSRTGTVSLKGANQATAGTSATGTTITVTPPTNSGSAVAGVAYKLYNKFVATTGGFCENWIANQEFSCADVAGSCATAADPGDLPATCNNGNIASINVLSCKGCSSVANPCTGTTQCNSVSPGSGCNGATCASLTAGGSLCDKRSAGMISGGCTPCGLETGSTVSVTDALGTVATVILTA